MALEEGLFPIDPAGLVGGAAMVYYTECDVTDDPGVPDRFEDILEPFGPDYVIKDPWKALGAAREGQGSTYGRNLTATDWNVEQRQQAVKVEITDVPRTMLVQIAEITADHIKMFEEAEAVEDLGAAGAGQTAQDRVRGGAVDSLTSYRIAMIGMRLTGEGEDVIEDRGGTPAVTVARGAFVGTILHRGQMARENAEYELQKGQMANIPVSFTGFPEPGMDRKKAVVTWLFERPGTYTKGP